MMDPFTITITFAGIKHGRPQFTITEGNADTLTPRQIQILKLMSDGYSNGKIARQIGYSESTVRHETMTIYRKLSVECRRDAVEYAHSNGLLLEEKQDD